MLLNLQKKLSISIFFLIRSLAGNMVQVYHITLIFSPNQKNVTLNNFKSSSVFRLRGMQPYLPNEYDVRFVLSTSKKY